ncbi:MAG: pentapeptide repeat-containing protein [Gloeomargarita sp. DG_2_bins_126]
MLHGSRLAKNSVHPGGFWPHLLHLLGCVITIAAYSPAYGYDPTQLAQLKTTKQCPNCDLSRADLQNQDLTGANLQGANLTNAILA